MTDSKIGLMLDIESLDLGPRSVVLQVGIIVFPLDDPSIETRRIDVSLPAQPQIALGRTFSFKTLLWWTQQDEKARGRLIENDGNDMEELTAFVRSIHRKVNEEISRAGGQDNIELWSKGPQFDVVNLESLFADVGLDTPWRYDRVMDLRTAMRLAQVKTDSVDASGIVPHVATEDCRFQIRCYAELVKQLHSNE